MRHDAARTRRRPGAESTLLFGIVAVVGGGACSVGPTPAPAPPPVDGPPSVSVTSTQVIAAAGTPVTFTGFVFGSGVTTLQWCRKPAGSTTCTPIAGATGTQYTLQSAALDDDGATFALRASTATRSAEAGSTLLVSAQAPVSFADGDFAPADWTTTVTAEPAGSGSLLTETVDTGGNPAAWRRVLGTLASGQLVLRGLHLSSAAAYDPATQGAVRLLTLQADCRLLQGAGSPEVLVAALPLIEQAGRRYVADGDRRSCFTPFWAPIYGLPWVTAVDFTQIDGPACGSGERCPDFTATGAPFRLGVVTESRLGAGARAQTTEQGLDNLAVQVWRD